MALHHFKCIQLFSVLPLVTAVSAAYAAQQTELEAVVVTATGYEQDLREAPASISVITNKQLQTKPVSDLGQAVGDVPGVDISETKMGNATISMRGFGSNYTMILVDGRRQNTSDGMIVNGFDPASVILPPTGAIDRIEVLRGPASTIYGSDAVGGVVNIITKKHVQALTGTIQIDRTQFFDSDQFGNRTGASVYLGIPLREDVASVQLRGRYVDRDGSGLRTPDGSFASHSPSEGYTGNVGARLNLSPDSANDIFIDGDFTRFQGGAMSTSAYGYKAVRDWNKYNAVIGHTGRYSLGTLESYAQWNSMSLLRTWHGEGVAKPVLAETVQGSASDPLANSTTYTLATKFTSPVELDSLGSLIVTSGMELNYETYKDNSSNAAETAGSYDYPTIRGEKLSQTTVAAFAEGEYFINDQWITTLGGRVHWSDQFGAHFAPRGYVVYKPSEALSFKGGAAAGYKTPAIKQLFNGIYYYGSGSYIVGDSNLKPEQSWNYELSSTLKADQLGSVTLGVFYTDFKNMLDTRAITSDLSQAVNHGRVVSKGLEVLFKSVSYKGLRVSGGYTFTDARIRSGERIAGLDERPNELPRHSLSARLDYENDQFSAYIKSVSKFDSRVELTRGNPNQQKYRDYTKVDVGMNYVYAKRHTVSVALNNVFDTGVQWVQSYASSAVGSNAYKEYIDGRNLWLSYAYSF